MFLSFIILEIISIFCQCDSDHEETHNFSGGPCRINSSGLNGICRPIQECPSAKKNLSKGIRPQICGFQGINSLVCCTDDVPSTTELSAINEARDTTVIALRETQPLSLQKCLEYRNRVYPNLHCPLINESVEEYRRVPAEKYPYFAYIGYIFQNKTTWGCYGELISELYVLTTDTCLYSFAYGYAKFVRLGGNLSIPSDFDKEQIQVINVAELIKYPRHLSRSVNHRIALLKLEKPAVFNRFVLPVCLPTGRHFQNIFTATDWKYLYTEGAQYDTHLREVIMEEVPSEKCEDMYGKTPLHNFCASLRKRVRDQCTPKGGLIEAHHELHCMYTLIGFEVSSSGCEAGLIPVLYTRVSPYLNWIEKNVWLHENQ